LPKDELHKDENLIGAIARGTIDGGKLAFNVAIMLVSFLALVALLDGLLGWAHGMDALGSGEPGADSGLFVCAGGVADRRAVARLRSDRQPAGHAHGAERSDRVHPLGAQKATLLPRSFTIATFALCGFANLGSIGMQIGGIGALVPERRNDLAQGWACARCWRGRWRT
jgi:CNT family concentrative nucleoside transporter